MIPDPEPLSTATEPKTEYGRPPTGLIPVLALLHFVCCGLPLLLLSGFSLAFLAPYWPWAAGVLAVVGVIGFGWYLKRGCATCPGNDQGRCAARLRQNQQP